MKKTEQKKTNNLIGNTLSPKSLKSTTHFMFIQTKMDPNKDKKKKIPKN